MFLKVVGLSDGVWWVVDSRWLCVLNVKCVGILLFLFRLNSMLWEWIVLMLWWLVIVIEVYGIIFLCYVKM